MPGSKYTGRLRMASELVIYDTTITVQYPVYIVPDEDSGEMVQIGHLEIDVPVAPQSEGNKLR